MKIGILGAGFIGRALAAHALANSHEVMISNSRGAQTLRSAAVALRCKVGSAEEAAAFGDLVMLAVPMSAVPDLPAVPLAGKVVVDANNYYPDRDGPIPELDDGRLTTSGFVARHLLGAKVVKAFNAILVNDLERDGLPPGSPGRRALPIAGDDEEAKSMVASLMSQFGFDAVDTGSLEQSWRFERARPVYCRRFDKPELEAALAATRREDQVVEGSWRA